MRNQLRPRRVEDWDEKLVVAMELHNAVTPYDLADLIYPDDEHMALKVQNNLNNWKHHLPVRRDGPGPRFFDDFARFMGLPPTVSGANVIKADIEEFVGYLLDPAMQRKAWLGLRRHLELRLIKGRPDLSEVVARHLGAEADREQTLNDVADLPMPEGLGVYFTNLLYRRKGLLQSIRRSIETGRLDQKHYYLTPEAADGWQALVLAEAYPTYDHCKAGLRSLVNSEPWKQALRERRPDAVVMLTGGGAPTKDLVLINSLLREASLRGQSIAYYLVDISPYMLWASNWWLEDSLGRIDGGDRVKVQTVVDDVLELRELTSKHFRGHSSIIFGVTGGTIGNLREAPFFAALNRVSREGDLLILSADTFRDGGSADTESRLIGKYDHEELHRFISPAVTSLAGQMALSKPVRSIFEHVKVELRNGLEEGFSDVPRSRSITMTLEADDQAINLLSSTRYEPDSLVRFAADQGWIERTRIPSPLNPDFVQFFFERGKSKKGQEIDKQDRGEVLEDLP